jgi:hypothetical protein
MIQLTINQIKNFEKESQSGIFNSFCNIKIFFDLSTNGSFNSYYNYYVNFD